MITLSKVIMDYSEDYYNDSKMEELADKKALANLAKKVGPILVPIINGIASALSWGAKGVAWLASYLWVIVVTIALILYNNYSK